MTCNIKFNPLRVGPSKPCVPLGQILCTFLAKPPRYTTKLQWCIGQPVECNVKFNSLRCGQGSLVPPYEKSCVRFWQDLPVTRYRGVRSTWAQCQIQSITVGPVKPYVPICKILCTLLARPPRYRATEVSGQPGHNVKFNPLRWRPAGLCVGAGPGETKDGQWTSNGLYSRGRKGAGLRSTSIVVESYFGIMFRHTLLSTVRVGKEENKFLRSIV